MKEIPSSFRHDSAVLRTLPLSGSPNKQVSGFISLTQNPSLTLRTPDTRKMLSKSSLAFFLFVWMINNLYSSLL